MEKTFSCFIETLLVQTTQRVLCAPLTLIQFKVVEKHSHLLSLIRLNSFSETFILLPSAWTAANTEIEYSRQGTVKMARSSHRTSAEYSYSFLYIFFNIMTFLKLNTLFRCQNTLQPAILLIPAHDRC